MHDQEQLSQQLQQALDSLVVIEQAKGITDHQNTVPVNQDVFLGHPHPRQSRGLCSHGSAYQASSRCPSHFGRTRALVGSHVHRYQR